MKTVEFLKLIGAPWAAFHDHPFEDTAKSLAYIRPSDCTEYGDDEVCSVYCCSGIAGDVQQARRDLIAAAPDLYAALAMFVEQWNACGPNSDFGRYFGNVRDAAVKALAKAEGESA